MRKPRRQKSIFDDDYLSLEARFVAFGSILALGGFMFLALASVSYWKTLDTEGWNIVPAKIKSVSVSYPQETPTDSKPFEIQAEYEYEVDGKSYSGTRFQRKAIRDDSYQKLVDHRWQFMKDEICHAHVNQNDPSESFLQLESSSFGRIGILASLIPVVVGLLFFAGGTVEYIRRNGRQFNSYKKSGNKEGGVRYIRYGVRTLGAVILSFGLIAGYVLVYVPFNNARTAKSWRETACTVLWSRVRTQSGDSVNANSFADVFYEYEFEGDTYRSNEYAFMDLMSTGDNPTVAGEIVSKYPDGTQATCYVDPNVPWHAVINREARFSRWVLLPVGAILLGLWISVTRIVP